MVRSSSLITRTACCPRWRSSTGEETRSSYTAQPTPGQSSQGETKLFSCFFLISIYQGIGWYFNKFFPHTEIFGRFITNSIETGLVEAWRRDTLRGMRAEYHHSQEEKIVFPDETGGGDVINRDNDNAMNTFRETSQAWRRPGRILPAGNGSLSNIHSSHFTHFESKDMRQIKVYPDLLVWHERAVTWYSLSAWPFHFILIRLWCCVQYVWPF